ncbi:FkbM family methyltransferase [Agrobacterium sp. 22-214-1]
MLISYAQNGEDILLWRALNQIAVGFYVDVGANDPEEDSVTKLFYDKGWRGINIEPSSEVFGRLNAARPRDINLQCLVGAEDSEQTFYETTTRGWGTSASDVGEEYVGRGLAKRVTLQQRSLNSILSDYWDREIHFLKIDVEGAEGEVLQGLDLQRFKPWILVVEALDPIFHLPRTEGWEENVLSHGYKKVFFDGLNNYYLHETHSDLEQSLSTPANVLDNYQISSLSKWISKSQSQDEEIRSLASRLDAGIIENSQLTAENSRLTEKADQLNALIARHRTDFSGDVPEKTVRLKIAIPDTEGEDDTKLYVTVHRENGIVGVEPIKFKLRDIWPRSVKRAVHATWDPFRDSIRQGKIIPSRKIWPAPFKSAFHATWDPARDFIRYGRYNRVLVSSRKIWPRPVKHAFHATWDPIRDFVRDGQLDEILVTSRKIWPRPIKRAFHTAWDPIKKHLKKSAVEKTMAVAPMRRSRTFKSITQRNEAVIFLFVGQTVNCNINTGVQRVVRGLASGLIRAGKTVRFIKWDEATAQCVLINRKERETLALWEGPPITPSEETFYERDSQTIVLLNETEFQQGWLIIPEVLHLHTDEDLALNITFWAHRNNLKVGSIFYDAIPLKSPEWAHIAPAHQRYMSHLRLSDAVWPISNWSGTDLLAFWKTYDKADAGTLPVCEPLALPGSSSSHVRVSDRSPSDERLIACIGTIEPRKNQLALVEAFRTYKQQNPESPWRLVLVGNLHPLCAPQINAAVKDGIIEHHGHVSEHALSELYSKCAFTVFPSKEEGFGLPILESLWYGKPCICANFGAMAEVAQGGGCVTIDVTSPKKIGGALKKLIENQELRQKLIDEAVSREISNWDQYAAGILNNIARFAVPWAQRGKVFFWVDSTVSFPKNTGIQRVTRQLARALCENGADVVPVKWDVTARKFIPANADDLTHLAEWNGPKVSDWGEWEEPQGVEYGWFIMPELPLNFSPDDQMAILKTAQNGGLKAAAVFYDAIPWKMTEIYPEHYAQAHAAYMRVLAAYDAVLPISNHSAQDFLSFLGADMERPSGIDFRVRPILLPNEFPETPRVKQVVPPQTSADASLTILSVGTIEPRKNHLKLVEAFKLARTHAPCPLRLVIVGREDTSTYGDKFREAIDGQTDIVWDQDANDQKLHQLLTECDFTVYPSIEEGYGLPIVESLWLGKPCICANSGAMAEVANAGCLTVDVSDEQKIADAIVEMCDPETRDRLAAEAITSPVTSWRDYAFNVAKQLADICVPPSLAEASDAREISKRTSAMLLKPRPKLSICISTYNRAEWLAVNLKNWALLYPEPLKGVEFFVCDNTSTDHTPEVVQPYLSRPDFTYRRNPENVGMLGNLRVTANHANGEYIWILGDDDLIYPDAVERVLAAIDKEPDIGLVYLNYAYTHLEDARKITDFEEFFQNSTPIVPPEDDRIGLIKDICTRNENFFTAIYTLVFRRDHAINAYSQNTDGRPFSSMLTAIPTTFYVLNHMMDTRGVWLGKPALVVNLNVSWMKYAPLWILERIPEVYEVAEWRGADSGEMDRWRVHTLPGAKHFFTEILTNDPLDNGAYFDPQRFVRRFKHLQEFKQMRAELVETYTTASSNNVPCASKPVSTVFAHNIRNA